MRVAHFVQRYPPAIGGAESYFARLSRFLVEAGDQVTVFTTTAIDLEAFWGTTGRRLRPGRSVEDGVEVRRYRLHYLPLYHTRALRVVSLLCGGAWGPWTVSCNPISWGMWADAGRSWPRFDVVHATSFPYAWGLACARRLARRLNVPFVLTPFVHLGDLDDPRDRTRRGYTSPALLDLARSAAVVFVQTDGEREALVEAGVPGERLVMQGMGLDRASCLGGDRDRARRAWKVAPGEVVVGHLANNSREKGTVDLLKAIQLLWQRGGRVRVVLAGPDMPNFRAFWAGYRPVGPVVRLGRLDEEQKRDFFAGIDVFCLPSRSDSFGLVLPEAWANGAPCVGYRAGGIPWVIRDGVDGLIVRCGDLNGLAAALGRLAADGEWRRRLGEAGRARTERELDWGEKLALVREVYRKVVAGGSFSSHQARRAREAAQPGSNVPF
jgi:glycosyltransferase involved in cell wall biosynthesis